MTRCANGRAARHVRFSASRVGSKSNDDGVGGEHDVGTTSGPQGRAGLGSHGKFGPQGDLRSSLHHHSGLHHHRSNQCNTNMKGGWRGRTTKNVDQRVGRWISPGGYRRGGIGECSETRDFARAPERASFFSTSYLQRWRVYKGQWLSLGVKRRD